MSKLNALYLANKDESILSQWDCEIVLKHSKNINDGIIVIPSITPSSQLVINVKGLSKPAFERLFDSFCRGTKFWETLEYRTHYRSENESMICDLHCKQFSNMKIDLLLDTPLSSTTQDSTASTVDRLDKVVITVQFYFGQQNQDLFIDIVAQCNEYMNSILVSQLEFKLPLIFSERARGRLKRQETSIGLVSKCLDNSQNVTPSIVKVISNDMTSTTIFKVLNETSHSHKAISTYMNRSGRTTQPQIFEIQTS